MGRGGRTASKVYTNRCDYRENGSQKCFVSCSGSFGMFLGALCITETETRKRKEEKENRNQTTNIKNSNYAYSLEGTRSGKRRDGGGGTDGREQGVRAQELDY